MVTDTDSAAEIRSRVAAFPDPLILFGDVSAGLPVPSVRRAMSMLVADGAVAELAAGVYVRLAFSEVWGERLPEIPLPLVGREYARRLGANVVPTVWQAANARRSIQQVTTGRQIGVDRELPVSALTFRGRTAVAYELVDAAR